MAVISAFNSVRTRFSFIFVPVYLVPPTTKAASRAMMPITTNNSINVKAVARRARIPAGRLVRLLKQVCAAFIIISARSDSSFAHFLFHSFAQPLFDHALVIQESRARQAFDSCQHPRINPQGNRYRLRRLRRSRDGRFHQSEIRTVLRPERRFGLVPVEERDFFPG